MEVYVGLDTGLEETSVCIIDRDGKTVRETKVPTEPSAIRSAMNGFTKGIKRIGVEASSLGLWLHWELYPAGLPIIVVEARHMSVSLSTMRNKTDRNDARGIAQMMRLGWYRAVYVKNAESQKLRTLLANRKLLKRKLVDVENHIRGALRGYGLFVGAVGRGRYDARIRELIEHTDYVFKTMMETMLTVRQGVFDGYDRLHKVLLQVVKHDAVCRRFMTVPGVGPVAALSFKLGVDDPLRFSRSRTVGAHFGLTPKHIQSGTSIDYEGRITKRGDITVREALCEAAASHLLRVKQWTALRAWGLKIAKRRSMMCAIVAVARKLATILHRMWTDGTEYKNTLGAKIVSVRFSHHSFGVQSRCISGSFAHVRFSGGIETSQEQSNARMVGRSRRSLAAQRSLAAPLLHGTSVDREDVRALAARFGGHGSLENQARIGARAEG